MLREASLQRFPPAHCGQRQSPLLGGDGGQGIEYGAAAPLVFILLQTKTQNTGVGQREMGCRFTTASAEPNLNEVAHGAAGLQVGPVQDPLSCCHGCQILFVSQRGPDNNVGAARVERLLV